MGKIKLICDSMADLTKDQIEKYDIEVLPLTVILDDKEYKDGIDFELDEFYQLLKDKKYPKTSQVTYGQFSLYSNPFRHVVPYIISPLFSS